MSSPTPARGRPPGDHDSKRQQVAEATWRVIQAQGIDRASLRSIAREAGCTTGVITHYFRDKDELLSFAIEAIFDWIREATDTLAAHHDPLEALRELYRAVLPVDDARRLEWSVWLSFLARAQHNASYAQAILSWHSELRERLQAIIARGQDRGSIRRDLSARVLADQFNAALDGLALMAPFERERFPEGYLHELMELALDHLKPQPATTGRRPGESPA